MVDRKEIDNTGQTEPRQELQTSERQGPSAQNLPSRPFIDSVRSRFFNRTTLALAASTLTLLVSSSIFPIEEKGNIQAEGLGKASEINGLSLPHTFINKEGQTESWSPVHGTMSLPPNPLNYPVDSINRTIDGVAVEPFQPNIRNLPEIAAGNGVNTVVLGVIVNPDTNQSYHLLSVMNIEKPDGTIYSLKVEQNKRADNPTDYSPGNRLIFSEGLPTEVSSMRADMIKSFKLKIDPQGEQSIELATGTALDPEKNGLYETCLDKQGNFITKFVKKVSEIFKLYLPMVFKVHEGASN